MEINLFLNDVARVIRILLGMIWVLTRELPLLKRWWHGNLIVVLDWPIYSLVLTWWSVMRLGIDILKSRLFNLVDASITVNLLLHRVISIWLASLLNILGFLRLLRYNQVVLRNLVIKSADKFLTALFLTIQTSLQLCAHFLVNLLHVS
jgi:hypothetical protein